MEKLKNLINSNKTFRIFGVPRSGFSVQVRNVKIQTSDNNGRWWYGNDVTHVMYSYTKNGKRSVTDWISAINIRNNSIKLMNYTYYLDPNKAYAIIIDRIRNEKRKLNAKQLKLQIELAEYGKNI